MLDIRYRNEQLMVFWEPLSENSIVPAAPPIKHLINSMLPICRWKKWLTVSIVLSLLGATITMARNKRIRLFSSPPSLEEVRAEGALRSSFKNHQTRSVGTETPQPKLEAFRQDIQPVLKETCFKCHGPKKQKGDFRVDTLNPDLFQGGDVDWWLDVMDVLTNSEMPPEDEEEMADEDRGKVIEWLASEIQVASQVRRSEQGHSSFRRMTRYEYNYALQDLLGLPYDFARDLPPETHSEDGFENSSEMLQMSVMQFETYRELGRKALQKATVRGEQPETLYYGITMDQGAAQMEEVFDADVEKAKKTNTDNPERLKKALENVASKHDFNSNNTHFKNLLTNKGIKATWRYSRAKQSYSPSLAKPKVPAFSPDVLIIPVGKEQTMDLGDFLPDTGIFRVRVRASHVSSKEERFPSLRLMFGNQPSNNSETTVRVRHPDVLIQASPEDPQFYQWDVPLSEYPRNLYRGVNEMGITPNPTEYIVFQNVTQILTESSKADIQIDYLEVTTPYYEQWPPESHTRIFIKSKNKANEPAYAKDVLTNFMPRAWRRSVTDSEIDQKLSLFSKLRPLSIDFQEAMIEVLATVLASPKFLYLVQSDPDSHGVQDLTDYELATRLSMFLWSSTPDDELLELARKGKLNDSRVLTHQTKRMLADPRSQRFAKHFVRQWLGMQLLDFLKVEEESYPDFDTELKEAMQQEPIVFFQEVLEKNHSVMNFLHADYSLVNERLARHYGLSEIYGNHFQKVKLNPADQRGGLMTQAGLLAMNSDGKDSHPLKRGIWMLERLLNDPPPAPPAVVPEIDLTDPEIAKLTLKERIENHRNDAACFSCHAKIDPWGIAFENFDAVGSWRDEINDVPVDASSLLFNDQKLNGIDGLKRFLLANRQDQFCRSMVHKLTTYALGRPLTFSDRAGIDEITVNLRNKEDRLGELIVLIINSDLFKTK
jgi:hypothetical protein